MIFLSVLQKELRVQLAGATVWVIGALYSAAATIWYLDLYNFPARDYASFQAFFSWIPAVMCVLVPLLTMKTWSDEKSSGTLEVLLTMPIPARTLVLAKFTAVFTVLLIVELLPLPVLLILRQLGDFPLTVLLVQYLGVILAGMLALSISLLISWLSSSQITSAIISALVLTLLTLVFPAMVQGLVLPQAISASISYLGLAEHFSAFSRGIISMREVGYYLLGAAMVLAVHSWSLEQSKWRRK